MLEPATASLSVLAVVLTAIATIRHQLSSGVESRDGRKPGTTGVVYPPEHLDDSTDIGIPQGGRLELTAKSFEAGLAFCFGLER
jgi:hypothetical protein